MKSKYFFETIIKKMGTVDVDTVETTPFVYNDTLYRFEYVRPGYYANDTDDSYFRIVDVKKKQTVTTFAKGYHLGCAYTEGNTVYCFGTNIWDGEIMKVFWSDDLSTWKEKEILNLKGWGIFNSSVCKYDKGYLMTFEVGKPPKETGERFTMRFARSDNLKDWTVLPKEYAYSYDKYSACGTIRYYNDYVYMVYLESVKDSNSKYGTSWEQWIVRTKDLIHWEESEKNPVLHYSKEDKKIANKELSDELKQRIKTAYNVNNSDFDICEYNGKTIIYYSWGSQHGCEHLAYAVYEGSEREFLSEFF